MVLHPNKRLNNTQMYLAGYLCIYLVAYVINFFLSCFKVDVFWFLNNQPFGFVPEYCHFFPFTSGK
uniref:Putative ovule protein n=1 Tax=Solanum chacoense TaxID=4108 RepID=A0A0V0GRN2_SOLCH